MKKSYSRYKHKELEFVEKRLNSDDKKVLDEFLKKCSITASPKKVNKIKKLLIQFRDVTQTPLNKQTQNTIDSFLVLLSNSDRSRWTKDEIKVYVKQFILWLYKDPSLVENFKACSKKGLNPEKINESNLVTEKDIEKMLRYAESYKEKAYLLLSFSTGARPQELMMLKWSGIKFEDKYADISLFSTKTKESRTFPIVEKTKEALWEWKQHYSYSDVSPKDYVFPSRWRDKPMSSAGLNKMLRRMAKASGLSKDVWGYLLRHSRATKLYEELPQQICEKLLGHKNMAGVYAHISSKKSREMMLEKIYKIEELTPDERNKMKEMENKVDDLSNRINLMLKIDDERNKILNAFLMESIKNKHKKDNPEFYNEVIKIYKDTGR